MTESEFRNAMRCLLQDAARGGLGVNAILIVAGEELHGKARIRELEENANWLRSNLKG